MTITFDPHDMEQKRKLHPKADEKNFIDQRGKSKTLVLRCGAKKAKGKEGLCRSIAGMGTNHSGYGRCKYCGGASTGPKTKEGLEKATQNSRKHGLYARHLTEEEEQLYGEIRKKNDLSLADELALLRTKLLSYYKHVYLLRRGAGRNGLKRTHLKRGDRIEYEMGSIEDPNVQKTLEQIRRLIATSNSIDALQQEDLIIQMNAELKAAALKETTASWSGRPSTWVESKE
jgi:hypothetical protein